MKLSRKFFIIIGVLLLLSYPMVETKDFRVFLTNRALLHAILVSGLVFLTGFAGQISLGQAGFYAIGAYGTALLTTRLGLPIPVGIVGGILLSLAAGLILSIPSFSLKAFFLSLVTISFGQVVWMLVLNAIPLTGGPGGLFGIPQFHIGEHFFDNRAYYYVFLAILCISILLMYRIKHSYIGRAMFAINDDEVAAESCGISSKKAKIFAFGFASSLAGLAGALYAHFAGFLSPEPFTFGESSNFVAMAVVGGLKHMGGGIIGGVGLTFLPELLKFKGWETYYMLFTSLIAILFVVLLPTGLGPYFSKLFNKIFGSKNDMTQTLHHVRGLNR
ncbi:MAG TPA: branched-chain amino acid ABC transporter permease [Aminobacterium sp.]|uniref:branched-chain amino acid ABC transporter permease n=1 Tax=Aminobacterium TaxID=81466 RepID=UPI00046628CA|nr:MULTISPECIES: branched-chain amino acid ABC transporter permease [Aminobacterium]HCA41322.1 branched-chain amino acid ABC transporter permease [Aminobacterium sp.]